MRTAVFGIFISLWLALALYVAVLALVAALRRGRHAPASSPTIPTMPSPRLPSSSLPRIGSPHGLVRPPHAPR